MAGRRQAFRWLALTLVAVILTACGVHPPDRAWSTSLSWGSDVVLGRQPDGAAVGPLAAAASTDGMVLADSFGHRLLVWRRDGTAWSGPVERALPTRSAIVAVALGPAGTSLFAVAADASGGLWAVPESGSVRRLADLRAPPGEFRTVTALAVTQDGTTVADAVDIGAHQSTRVLIAVEPTGGMRVIGSASIARASASASPGSVPVLLSPRGVRDGLAPCSAAGVWVATRASGRTPGTLLCLGTDGRVLRRRPWPELRVPADFLGVDRQGRAYALEGAGSAVATVVVFGEHGRVRRMMRLPAGSGPLLPHPAALAPNGALLLLSASSGGVQLLRLPAGVGIPGAGPDGNPARPR